MKQLIIGIVIGACFAGAVISNVSTVAEAGEFNAHSADPRPDSARNRPAPPRGESSGPRSNCPGDINGDGVVDVSDLLALLSGWGPCPGCQGDPDCGPNQICVDGDCLCTGGFANCDGDANTGCEADLATDPDHCGSCNIPCATGETCVDGACTSGCTDVFYADLDGDGWGNCDDFIIACGPTGVHTATICGDCNDNDPTIYPGAPEFCNGIDNDCDGEIDNNVVDCPPGTECINGECVTP